MMPGTQPPVPLEVMPEIREPAEARRGSWPMWVTTIAVMLLPLVVWGLCYGLFFNGLTSGDAMDYGQIARNLISGRGYSTSILRPLLMSAEPVRGVLPEITHAPLYPALLALGFGVLGVKDVVLAAASGVGYVITAWLLIWAGSRFASIQVGLAASTLYSLHARAIENSLSGLPNTLASALVLALVLILLTILVDYEAPDADCTEGQAFRAAFSMGVCLGFLALFDGLLAWLAIPAILGLNTGFRARSVGLWRSALGGFLLVALPWWIWIGFHSGNPIQGGRGWEWLSLGRVAPEVVYRTSAEMLWQTPWKANVFALDAFNHVQRALGAGAGILGVALVGCFAASLSWMMLPQVEGVRRIAVGICAAALFGLLLAPSSVVMVQAILPVVVLLSVAFLFGQLDRGGHPSYLTAGVALLILFCAVPFTPSLQAAGKVDPSQGLRFAASKLKQRVERDELVLSDQPWLVAWYTGRSAVWIPSDERLLEPSPRKKLNLRWVYLSPNVKGYSAEWSNLYDVFHAWNEKHGRSWATQDLKAGLVTVRGNKGAPLLSRLSGLTLMPVPEAVSTPAVVAGFPREFQRGQKQKRAERPLSAQ